LEEAGDYIAFKLLNPTAAENTISGIRKQINRLQMFPKSKELDADPVLAALGVRNTYFKDYKAYFIVDDENLVVYVVRVSHMLVDSRAWLYATFGVEL